jgi:simple sugar transport system permease protein
MGNIMSGLETILTGALDSAISYALVVGLASVGQTVTERAGILNLGLEGVVLMGAFGGFALAYVTGQAWLGLLGGLICGCLLGLIMAVWSVSLKTEQVINGLLLFMVSSGLSSMLYKQWFMSMSEPPRVNGFGLLPIPILSQIPVIGPALFHRPWSSYVAFAMVAVTSLFLYRTQVGLICRACGDSPESVDFSGMSVVRHRYLALTIGSALAGLAGSLLTVEQLKLFAPGISAGRGWIALSIVIVGGWRPWGCMAAALLFGVTDMFQFQFQGRSDVPYELLLALPYIMAIAALTVRRHTVRGPQALGVPFRK